MESSLYLEKQIRYELLEKFHSNLSFLNCIDNIEITYKTNRLTAHPYLINYVLRYFSILSLFTGSYWSIKKHKVKVLNKSLSSSDSNTFFFIYNTKLMTNDILLFLNAIFLYLIFKRKLNKQQPTLVGFLGSDCFYFNLFDIQKAPWLSPSFSNTKRVHLKIKIKIKNKYHFLFMLSKLGLLDFFKIKKVKK